MPVVPPTMRAWQRLAWSLLLCLAATEFLWRGPMRAQQSRDFSVPYLTARAWWQGLNPYDVRQLAALWEPAGGPVTERPYFELIPPVYPPTTMLVLLPFAWLSWPQARWAFALTSIALYGLLLWALWCQLALPKSDWRNWALLAIGLGFAPVHTGLANGNVIVAAASCTLLAALWSERTMLATSLLVVALCLKPQIGLLVWLAWCVQRRWRTVWLSTLLILGLGALSVARLAMAESAWPKEARLETTQTTQTTQTTWFAAWAENRTVFTQAGNSNDPTVSNRIRHDLLHLPRLLHTGLADRQVVNWLTALLTCLLGGALVAGYWLQRGKEFDWLLTSACLVLGLLPVYHRFYDASVLLLPLAWALAHWHSPAQRWARASFCLCVPWLVPGAALLFELARRGAVPAGLVHSPFWENLLMAHPVWLLLLLLGCLLGALWQPLARPATRVVAH